MATRSHRKLLEAADACDELLVLLTPWSITKPYIWMETALFLHAIWRGHDKRIVPVFYGLDELGLVSGTAIPAELMALGRITLNDMPAYFSQLRQRLQTPGGFHE